MKRTLLSLALLPALSALSAPALARQSHAHPAVPPAASTQASTHDPAAHAPGDAHAAHGRHAGHAHPQHATPRAAAQDPHAGHRGRATPAGHAPVPAPTEADRIAAFPVLHHAHHHAPAVHSLVRIDRLEAWDGDEGRGQAWDATAWIGGDVHRLWLRSAGEREAGHTRAADLEVLYGQAVSAWWDVLAGVRHDTVPGAARTRLALGVQGLAPYKFEVEATAYVDGGGHVSVEAEAGYTLLLTRRLILGPELHVKAHGHDDARRGTGSGLASAEAGLRLRYEITPRFAPYIGLVHERSFGDTADLRRGRGEAVRQTRWVLGLRTWF